MEEQQLFSKEELNNLQGAMLQQKAQEIKQRFDYRRNFFHTLRNNVYDLKNWTRLNDTLNDFDRTAFSQWNSSWNNIYRSPTIESLESFFQNGDSIYRELESKIGDIRPYKIEYQTSEEIQNLKKEIMLKIEEDMISLKSAIQIQIDRGIENLLNLKAELGLHQNFSENLGKVKRTSHITKYLYFSLFVLSLLGIGGFILGSFFIDKVQSLILYEKIALRLGVTLSLGFLSYFFFHQFKLYQIMHLKYVHLDNFLGGGATYITQIIGQDAELKKTTNQKLANMFMEIDDMIGTAKKMEHPSEVTMKSTNETVKTIVDKLGDISKIISDLKK